MLRHTLIEHDGESIEGGFPVLNRHGPFCTDANKLHAAHVDNNVMSVVSGSFEAGRLESQS